MNTRKIFIPAIVLVILSLVASACGASTPTPLPPTAMPPTTAPTQTPTQMPPTPEPTMEPAQPTVQELYMPRNVALAFANGTRSSDGNPGPNYWQNHAVHDISITVSPPSPTISGTETITYTNNSPDYLPRLPVRLYMNVRLPEAQRERNVSPVFLTSGVHIDEFAINDVLIPWSPDPDSGVTYKIIKLPLPLAPGETVRLSFKWHYDLSTDYLHEGVFDPTSFYLGYFFPRITNANDTDSFPPVPGFDVEEFTYRSGRERLDDFADFTVAVTVPKDFIVWATAELLNPDEVLQPTYAQRLADSMTSDSVSNIATPEETRGGQVTAQTNTVTWKWKADNVTTFGLGLSDHYIWDAGSVVVDPASGRRTSVQAAYPVEAVDYTTMVEDAKRALAFGSTQWPGVPYPYPKTTVFVGGGDEEFPMMANDSPDRPLPEQFIAGTVGLIATHELLHSWFPFYMGIDERRYPMLDEGWTTAFEYLAALDQYSKEDADALFKQIRSGNLVPSFPGMDIPAITPADSTRGDISGRNGYDKPALAYLALKELMGDEAFQTSLHEFIDRWHGKHPLPWDMFNTFNDTSDQDLTWFFNNWFFEPNCLDLAIEGVEKGANGTEVRVKNVGGFAIPFDVNVQFADDTVETFHQNPGIWKDSPEAATITIDSPKEMKLVQVDGGIYLDTTTADNRWPAPPHQDPNALVPVQVKNAAGTASITISIPGKSMPAAPGQFSLPSGPTLVLSVGPAEITPTDLLKSSATGLHVEFSDSDITDGSSIAGYPSKVLRSTISLRGVTNTYDAYAFSTDAATYQIQILLGYPPAADEFRNTVYPGLLETVVVEPSTGQSSTPSASSNPDLAMLTGQTWMWTEFTDPTQQFNVDPPENYTLHFLEDGAIQIKADCNTGSGTYTVDGSSIQIEAGAMTLAACPPESRSDDFIKYLSSAAIFFFKDGNLHIDLMADGGTMTFTPAAN